MFIDISVHNELPCDTMYKHVREDNDVKYQKMERLANLHIHNNYYQDTSKIRSMCVQKAKRKDSNL